MKSYYAVPNRNYSYLFNFEEEFVHQNTRVWMTKNWTSSFYICGLYMILIFGGKYYMQNRPKYNLKGALSIWSSLLAAFSLMGAFRTAPELFHSLKTYGFYHSVCCPSFIEHDRVAGVWTWLFVLSKLPELGDTVFIVLRKQPLIFLHWYHHITVFIYSWFSYSEYTATARWFVVMNFSVHSIMYTYYALRSMGYHPPRGFAMLITTCQLAQMVVGCAVNIYASNYMEKHLPCNVSSMNIKLSIAMYFSYFVLFANFFYKTYLSGSNKKSKTLNNVSDSYTTKQEIGKVKSH